MNSPTNDHSIADSIIEQLRFGIPPRHFTQSFTVGRASQIKELLDFMDKETGMRSLLLNANYGSGKSHLLKLLRDIGLERNYAVSLIEVNSDEGIRFNRMETIFGAICNELEVPHSNCKGVGSLFDAYVNANIKKLPETAIQERNKISRNEKWDYSEALDAPGIYVALRAWLHSDGNQSIRELVNDWLSNPTIYKSQRKLLYESLVKDLDYKFQDIRRDWQFYNEEVFSFSSGGHRQSWNALSDLNNIAVCSGYSGLLLLIDEFEDVIVNLKNKKYQEQAFYNLFRFFFFDTFPGKTYFAVTPEFVDKCKKMLISKGVFDFDFENFDALPSFQLDPISNVDFYNLAKKIRSTHGVAYNWDVDSVEQVAEFKNYCDSLMMLEVPNKIRQGIVSVVESLDSEFEEV